MSQDTAYILIKQRMHLVLSFGTIIKLSLLITIVVFVSFFAFIKLNLHFRQQLNTHLYSFFQHDRQLPINQVDEEIHTIKLNLSTYAICKSNLSEPLLCPKLREGRIHVSINPDLVEWYRFASNNWGNTLSPYWQARGTAFLMGNSFSCNRWNTNTWMDFLPISVTSFSSNSCIKAYPKLFQNMCQNSGPFCNMVYAHTCVGSWNHIRDQIQNDTRLAMKRWALLKNQTIPVFNMSEMVVYDRCSNDTILNHREHGPLAYSVFQYIPKEVKILYQVYAKNRTTVLCDSIRQSQIAYINQIRPDIVVIPSSGSLWQDFSKLVFAPYVLVISAGSSFALWSTLANVGKVWMPPLYGGMTPDVGGNYHWVNTPILYPNIGEKLNLTILSNINEVDKIIGWLRDR